MHLAFQNLIKDKKYQMITEVFHSFFDGGTATNIFCRNNVRPSEKRIRIKRMIKYLSQARYLLTADILDDPWFVFPGDEHEVDWDGRGDDAQTDGCK